MTEVSFSPVFQKYGTLEGTSPGWYMEVMVEGHSEGIYVDYTDHPSVLVFARKLDCQLACDAANDKGLSLEEWQELTNNNLRDIVLSRLMW